MRPVLDTDLVADGPPVPGSFKTMWAALPGCPASGHRLSPREMSLIAKRIRHVAVAIPEIRVSRGIAARPRQPSPQPQQPDVAYRQTLIGWRGCQPLERGLGFGDVSVGV